MSAICSELIGMDATNQRLIDRNDDRSGMVLRNKARFGCECDPCCFDGSIARFSKCVERCTLYRYLGGVNSCILPTPIVNILNGGGGMR